MRWSPRLEGEAPGHLRAGVVVLVLLANLVLAALGVVWLQIPDSHAGQVVLSVLLGVAIVLLFLLLYTIVLRAHRLDDATHRGLLKGMAVLAVWLAVWRLLAWEIGRLSLHVVERAGFWNSRLSSTQRNLFTEVRLEEWQNDVIGTLLWFVLPLLLLPLMVETVSRGLWAATNETSPLRAVVRVYACWQLWVTVGVASLLASTLVEKLLAWHAYDTVRGELASVVLRFGLGYVVLVTIGLGVLALVARLLARAAAGKVR